MSLIKYRAARRFVYAAAFHADETVLNYIEQAYAVCSADLVELVYYILCGELFSVISDRYALLEIERYISRFVGSRERRNAHLEKTGLFILRLVAGVFKVETLVREMPEVFVFRIVGFAADLQRHVVRFRVVYLFIP